jgi:cytoskeletal protein RodZ
LEEAEAKIEEMEAEARAKAEKEKKRNIWMIIGGVLMAILLFVGNQVLQSVRNIRTQRSMMQMQQDATNRAKNMAKSKAQGAIRKQTGKITNQAKQKGQTAMRNVIDKSTKKPGKNNRLSI